MAGLGDLLKAQMKDRLSEGTGGGSVEKGRSHAPSGGRVQDRASQSLVNQASGMFRSALMKKREDGDVEKAAPRPVAAPAPAPAVVKSDDLAKLERKLLISTLESVMENSKTLSKQVVGGLELLRDAVKEELAG